jgi:hypothetical protein
VRDRDAAPREGQYHQIVSAGEVMQLAGENCSGVPSIGKPRAFCGSPWNSHVRSSCNRSALARRIRTSLVHDGEMWKSPQ